MARLGREQVQAGSALFQTRAWIWSQNCLKWGGAPCGSLGGICFRWRDNKCQDCVLWVPGPGTKPVWLFHFCQPFPWSSRSRRGSAKVFRGPGKSCAAAGVTGTAPCARSDSFVITANRFLHCNYKCIIRPCDVTLALYIYFFSLLHNPIYCSSRNKQDTLLKRCNLSSN